jgi:uncharacterized protein YuzE
MATKVLYLDLCALKLPFDRIENDRIQTDDDLIVRYEGGKFIGLTILHASQRLPPLKFWMRPSESPKRRGWKSRVWIQCASEV